MFSVFRLIRVLVLVLLMLVSSVLSDDWEEVTNPDSSQGGMITSMAINSEGDVFLCKGDVGIFRSTNQGLSWDNLTDSTLHPFATVGISPQGNIYAMHYYGLDWNAIYMSLDNGDSWLMSDTSDYDISPLDGRCFGFDTCGYAYAGAGCGELYKSIDSTNEWSYWGDGLPCGQVSDLEYDPYNGVMIATISDDDTSGVFVRRSSDSVWARLGGSFYGNAVNAFLITSDGEYFVAADAGIYKYDSTSKCGGGDPGSAPRYWIKKWPEDSTWNPVLQLEQTPDGKLIACSGFDLWGGGSGSGVLISTDTGTIWSDFCGGLPASPLLTSLAIEHTCNGYMYVGTSFSAEVYRNYACSYLCGDANADSTVNIGDFVYIRDYIFNYGDAPDPYEAGDVNCDATVNIGDMVYIAQYIFSSGPRPCADCEN